MREKRDPGAELAREYSGLADAYARYWAPVIAPMARRLFGRMSIEKARRVLDLGCGAGDLLGDVRAAAPGATLIGVDPAVGMLRHAREKGEIALAAMDARHLAFPDRAFDAVVLSFVLFHVPDLVAALREIGRVLRADGVVGIVVWGKAREDAWNVIWGEELDELGAAPDMRDPILRQHDRMDTEEKLRKLVASGGLRVEALWTEKFEHRWRPEAVFEMQTRMGPHRRRLESLPEDARARCRTRVLERLVALSEEELVYRPPVIYAIAGPGGGR